MKVPAQAFFFALVRQANGSGLIIPVVVSLVFFATSSQAPGEQNGLKADTPEDKQDLAIKVNSILRQRCYGCHGPRRQKGDLRLDKQKYLSQPLSSGKSLLNTDPAKSELFQRITSSDPEFRMPENRDPLPPDEIETLKLWLQAGSPWDNTEEEVAKALKRLRFFEKWGSWTIPVKPFAAPIAIALFFWLILGRVVRSGLPVEREQTPRWRRLAGYIHRRPETLILFAIALGFSKKATLAREAEEKATTELTAIKREQIIRRTSGAIRRPLHPPRLGGTYYRGNDERDHRLYNNGFYCTCIFEVYLSQGDRRLAIGDTISPELPLKIAVQIDRAPFATPKLFNDERMTQAIITDQRSAQGQNLKAQAENDDHSASPLEVPFQTMEAGERWFAAFELPFAPSKSEETIEGKLFILPRKGSVPHYGLGYKIIVNNGTISTDSEIWMGSLYHTSDVIITTGNEIPLDHWFDFRPMPMIESGNSDDPELLGVKEHLNSDSEEKQSK